MRDLVTPCGAAVAKPILVLKFGSSILASAEGYRAAAREVRRVVASGYRVVAVVSAMGETTDGLLTLTDAVSPRAPEALVGSLLATGEEASVLLLTIALGGCGVHAVGVTPGRISVRTRGALHDADPVDVDSEELWTQLSVHEAVVVPGFVGVDGSGAPSLMGRGGSDLTALFLAQALRAVEVRLIKDVDGICRADPALEPGAEVLGEATWDEVAAIGGGVVQPKALDFARHHGVGFRVCALGGSGTWVGPGAVR